MESLLDEVGLGSIDGCHGEGDIREVIEARNEQVVDSFRSPSRSVKIRVKREPEFLTLSRSQ